jgi:hypothetical protein
MGSTPAVRESRAKEPDTKKVPTGISLGWGVVLMVAIAGGWILLLVAIHNITARLLS